MESKTQHSIKRIVQVSLLIALALVVRQFSYMVYIGGAPGMRFSFAEVFTKIAAILFGPLYGGLSSGIIDILGFMIKPEGAYIPLMTMTAILSGVMAGLIWKLANKANFPKARTYYLVSFGVIGIIGLVNYLFVHNAPDASWSQLIMSVGKNKDFLTIGLMITALIGFVLFGINLFVKKLNSKFQIQDDFFKILLAVGISGLITSTLNTLVLQYTIPELGKIPFLIFWVPRIIKELFMVVIQSYIISFLLSIYKRYQRGTSL